MGHTLEVGYLPLLRSCILLCHCFVWEERRDQSEISK